jgi:uncharacterized protein YecT (DUF1311 family)
MNFRSLAMLAGCAFSLGAASAQAEPAVDCKKDQSQMALNVCSFDRYKAADAELNGVYRKVTAGLDENEKGSLRAAQQAWINFRDAECRWQVGPREQGGSIWPLENNGCLTELTLARTKQLQKCRGPACPG